MATAFQADAFQNNAFQIDGGPPPPTIGDGLEKIKIGVIESISVTAYPTIGGPQAWFKWLPQLEEKVV